MLSFLHDREKRTTCRIILIYYFNYLYKLLDCYQGTAKSLTANNNTINYTFVQSRFNFLTARLSEYYKDHGKRSFLKEEWSEAE